MPLELKSPLKKCGKRAARSKEDQISLLPDDILVFILSYLTFKEAAATSVLSRRWSYLWMFFPRLHFDYVGGYPKLLDEATYKYVKWVNQVLQSYKGSKLQELRICFQLSNRSKEYIDEWIRFALARGVERLELDLTVLCGGANTEPYTFPLQFTSGPCEFVSFKLVKSLCLKHINVSGEVLESLLSSYCPVLERLVVWSSRDLVKLNIVGPSLMLKYLEICRCMGVKSISICDTNIISFKFRGESVNLLLKKVPLLIEVSIGGTYTRFFRDVFTKLSSCVAQLEILTLDTIPKKELKFSQFPELARLKKLILRIEAWDNNSLMGFTSLIKASPNLESFVLQLLWYGPVLTKKNIRKPNCCPHQNLKVVELAGYYGRTSDLELAMYFIENAVMLDRIIINPCNQISYNIIVPTKKHLIEKEEEAARSRAKRQLQGKVPPEIELVIL